MVLAGALLSATSVADLGVPNAAVREELSADWLTADERSSLVRTHGLWDREDLDAPDDRIAAALVVGDPRGNLVEDPGISPFRRGQWHAARGEVVEALAILDGCERTAEDELLRGDLLRRMGRMDEARRAFESVESDARSASRTAAVTALRRLAEMDEAGSQSYQDILRAYQSIAASDPRDWTSRLAEAQLLLDKSRPREAYGAVQETLGLNPRCGQAWLLWGRLALMRFDFDGAEDTIAKLRDIVPDHPLADLLEGEASLMQDEPQRALRAARRTLAEIPDWPPGLALEASALAVMEDPSLPQFMSGYERRFPGCPLAAFRAGDALSFQRQYAESDRWLQRAIEIRPEWPAAWIELGLMQWQDARMEAATRTLRRAAELDSFNLRAANSLDLLEELAGYETIDAGAFLIRYRPGPDHLLAQEMVPRLQAISDDITGAFEWTPSRQTVIELFPDHERFAVRVVGMPDIHTMAACTGPCIAMEVPRTGVPSEHLGPYDWERVLRHEFAHTVTLDQTDYRIPLWFTEAAAVWMEPGPRAWRTKVMLAEELAAQTLLSMDELSWAFVRPRRPQDRSLAYAQSSWMLEFIVERWGRQAMLRILEGFREGLTARAAFEVAIGLDEDALFDAFLPWAEASVRDWGLRSEPTLEELLAEDRGVMESESRARRRQEIEFQLRQRRDGVVEPGRWDGATLPMTRGSTIDDDDLLLRLLGRYPEHPDVLAALVTRLDQGGVFEGWTLPEAAEAYVALRPADPLGHRILADWWDGQGAPARGVESLAVLAGQEEYDPQVVRRYAEALRLAERYGDGAAAMERAVGISPFDPSLREIAAAAAIEASSFATAERHLRALQILEPDEPRHGRRLEAFIRRFGDLTETQSPR